MSTSKFKNGLAALFVLSLFAFSANIYGQTTSGSQAKSGNSNAQNKSTLQQQHGPRFVDANGDGICDNRTSTFNRPMDGSGRKNGMGKGNGMGLKGGKGGRGNGVCDGTGPKSRK